MTGQARLSLRIPAYPDWAEAEMAIAGFDEESGIEDLLFDFGDLVSPDAGPADVRRQLRADLARLRYWLSGCAVDGAITATGPDNPDSDLRGWLEPYWLVQRLEAIGCLSAAGIELVTVESGP